MNELPKLQRLPWPGVSTFFLELQPQLRQDDDDTALVSFVPNLTISLVVCKQWSK